MGLLASEHVAANFEQARQIEQLENFYEEAVALTAPERARVAREDAPIQGAFAEQVAAD